MGVYTSSRVCPDCGSNMIFLSVDMSYRCWNTTCPTNQRHAVTECPACGHPPHASGACGGADDNGAPCNCCEGRA